MKKLLVAATVVMFGIAANAATYKWGVSSGWVSPDDSDPLTGALVYAFDANVNSSASILAELDAATDGGAATFAKALGNGAVDGDGAFDLGGVGLTDNGAGSPTASMYAILVADKLGESYYYLVDTAPAVAITSAILAGATAAYDFGDVITGDVGGAGWAAVGGGAGPIIPEPTSGLLLLVGMAGLALRRRRA